MPKRISTKTIKKSAKGIKGVVGHDIGRDVISISGRSFPPEARLKDVFPRLEKRSQVGLVREDHMTDLVFQTQDGRYVVAQLKRIGMSSSNSSKTSSQIQEGIIDEVIGYATEVMGSREKALLWLGAPVRGLNFATPISLLATQEGVERVNEILGQMEHGIW
jgi:hypothetical protein